MPEVDSSMQQINGKTLVYILGSVSYQPAGRRLLGLLPAGWH